MIMKLLNQCMVTKPLCFMKNNTCVYYENQDTEFMQILKGTDKSLSIIFDDCEMM